MRALVVMLALVAMIGCSREPCRCRNAQGVMITSGDESAAEDEDRHAEARVPAATAQTPTDNPLDAQYASYEPQDTLRGEASYYHDSLAGNATANGDVYDPRAFTAAHRTLAFGTIVRVTRIDNGRTVTVRVNDRGPFGRARRLMDLSRAAAEQLDMIRAGVTRVRVDILHVPE